MATDTSMRLTIGRCWEEGFTMWSTRREDDRDKNHLHLIGLARIPRCAACRRFEALWLIYERRSPLKAPLPPVPPTCKYQICRPLVARCSEPVETKGRARPLREPS